MSIEDLIYTEEEKSRLELINAERIERRERKRAGKAAEENLSDELNDAINVFAAEDWANLTLAEIAKTGNRIGRLAGMMKAAERLSEAEEIVARLRQASSGGASPG